MKLAYSSVACPNWNLATMVEKAKAYGYQGIELRGLEGQMHLPLAPQIASNPAKIAELMEATGVALVCLSTSAAFHYQDKEQVAKNKAEVREYIELAGKLRCPYVRVFGSEIPKLKFSLLGYERREATMTRIADALRDLAGYAARHRVTILIENNGDFVDSASMWYLVDAVDSPGLRCCWNPFNAMLHRERPTTSIPRLGARIGMIRLTDGKVVDGSFAGYAIPGEGNLELARLVQLLKGVGYKGYVCLDWPKLWEPSLAEPDVALSKTVAAIRPMLDEEPQVLAAYKGDKFIPKLVGEGA